MLDGGYPYVKDASQLDGGYEWKPTARTDDIAPLPHSMDRSPFCEYYDPKQALCGYHVPGETSTVSVCRGVVKALTGTFAECPNTVRPSDT